MVLDVQARVTANAKVVMIHVLEAAGQDVWDAIMIVHLHVYLNAPVVTKLAKIVAPRVAVVGVIINAPVVERLVVMRVAPIVQIHVWIIAQVIVTNQVKQRLQQRQYSW